MNTNNDITVFAKTNFRNKEVPFGIKTDDRRRHMYIIGKTGMGKTTLMENMAIQDIHNGHGIAFLDPHGDSVQKILNCVPNSRINDVVYFNPADLEHPIAFNILEAVDAKYKHLVASGLMGVFTKIWANLWSARMEYILNNTILALLDSPGNTMLGIPRMYVDKKYRKKIVDNVKDPMVKAFWTDEFANYAEKYRTEAVAPIQNKVGQFLSSGIVRNIVGQPKSTLDLRELMDQRKILIMDLSKGKVGEDNSALLGAMIVTKLQLAAMSRTYIPEHDRKDFYLYVDEFQNFATESFATILSEARKYRLNLIVGHQYIAQLEQEKSTKVRDAIFGNVGSIIVFRVGAADAEFMETEFDPVFTPNDLVNLPKYSIILKLMINGVASEPFSATTLAPNPEFVTNNAEKVIKVSRERYANSVDEVEEKISRWMGAEFHQESAALVADGGPDKELSQETAAALTPPPVIEKLEVNNFASETVVQTEQPIELVQQAEAMATPASSPVTETVSQAPRIQLMAKPPREASDTPKPRNDFGGNRDNRGQGGREFPPRKSGSMPHRDNGRDSNRGGGNRAGHSDHGRSSQHRHESKRHEPTKRNNPIWDTVANLRSEKLNQAVDQILQPKPQAKPEQKPEQNEQSQTPQSAPGASAERVVLKPGESQKF